MAMSRPKSFLPHTQKNLWRTDTQHDLNVINSVQLKKVRPASLVLPCARGRLAVMPLHFALSRT